MSKFIKLVKNPVCGNRTYKILSIYKLQQKELVVKMGLIEYTKNNNTKVYIDVDRFLLHFLQGAVVSKKILNIVKRTNVIKSLWS